MTMLTLSNKNSSLDYQELIREFRQKNDALKQLMTKEVTSFYQ